MGEQTVVGQSVLCSAVWWLGLIACIVQGVCAVLVVTHTITVEVSAAVSMVFAGVMAYCNGNNPNVAGQYGAGKYGLKL